MQNFTEQSLHEGASAFSYSLRSSNLPGFGFPCYKFKQKDSIRVSI